MHLPPLRISLRSMLLLVLLAAILIRVEIRRQRFANLAEYHRTRSPVVPMLGSGIRGMSGYDSSGRQVFEWEIEWHRLLAVKYRRASLRPWTTVAPDPDREAFRDAFRDKARHLNGAPINLLPYRGPHQDADPSQPQLIPNGRMLPKIGWPPPRR